MQESVVALTASGLVAGRVVLVVEEVVDCVVLWPCRRMVEVVEEEEVVVEEEVVHKARTVEVAKETEIGTGKGDDPAKIKEWLESLKPGDFDRIERGKDPRPDE